MSSSRNLKLLPALLGLTSLAACGFTQLYGDNGNNVQQQMNEVAVGIIPNRPGQILRQ